MTEIANDLARAQAMLQIKRHDEAASLLARVVAAQPGDARAWCLLAAAHLGAGRYQEAADAAGRAIAAAPSDDWPYRLVSRAQALLRNPPAAMSAASEACRLAPNEWRAWVCMAQAAVATEVEFNAAERAAATARRLAPNEAEVYYVSGLVSFAREEWKKALAYQERVLAIDPAHTGALNELGRISLKKRNVPRAADHFLRAAGSAPGVAAFGNNVEVAVRSLLTRVIYLATLATWLLVVVTFNFRGSRTLAIAGLTVIALLSAIVGAARIRALPPPARRLLRSTRVTLAAAVVYGCIIIAIIVAAAVPASALPGALAAAGVLVVASRFIAYAMLRKKRP
ncbi:MAG: tetratricopeptide repeat protein [Actinobacteria bacterium]|nr:tetratricopeptide repeat protein [Actinomycetota bacterium]